MNDFALIELAADMIGRARRVTALTGAGLSTPSGVPDFRSPRSGLWNHVDVMEVASVRAFRKQPQAFYDWLRPLLETVLQATPNPAHTALAALEQEGLLATLITQNIDLLHSRAGSHTIHEIHGHLRELVCLACHYVTPAAPYWDAFLATGAVPCCPRCHHVLKPTVTLFGEMLPFGALVASERAATDCDLMLVAGTSLEVDPAGSLPLAAVASGARLIIINKSATAADDRATLVIRGDVAEVLPTLVELVRARRPS